MTISRWAILGSVATVSIMCHSALGARINMPVGSTVWMEWQANVCTDSAGSDCAGSNQAGPNPPNGIPIATFDNGSIYSTGSAEILPDRVRTLISGWSSFMFASFEDTYTVGGTAVGAFDIPVELHVEGVARSIGSSCPSPICNQLVGANVIAEIGTFTHDLGPTFSEGFRVQPFNASTTTTVLFPTEGSGSPFDRPIDITAHHTVQNVSVGDTIVLAYGVNSAFSKGEIDLLNTGSISFDLPPGVFLTSALAETLVPEPPAAIALGFGIFGTAFLTRRRGHN